MGTDMKLFLTSAYDVHRMLDAMLAIAESDQLGHHQLCDNPEEADAILFTEDGQFDDYLYNQLRLDPLVSRFKDKAFMYNEVDKPWCVLPGLYCNMPQRFFQHNRQIAFPLLAPPNDLVKSIYTEDDKSEREWLYSFVGAASHRCRKAVLALACNTPAVQDTSSFSVWNSDVDERLAAERNYADVMASSYFVLCPRGIGTSTYRLYETMEAGRAPVIIANQWVEPPHVDWDFAIRIREEDTANIPAYLQSIADEARDRGEAARTAWESAYAPDKLFNTVAESVAELKDRKSREQQTVYLSGSRKLLIDGEVRLTAMARKLRDRVGAFTSTAQSEPR